MDLDYDLLKSIHVDEVEPSSKDVAILQKYLGPASSSIEEGGYPWMWLAIIFGVLFVLLNPFTTRKILNHIGEWSYFGIQILAVTAIVGFTMWKTG